MSEAWFMGGLVEVEVEGVAAWGGAVSPQLHRRWMFVVSGGKVAASLFETGRHHH